MLIISILRYGGPFGNTIFLICTCWFFLDSKKTSVKKIVFMLIDIWTVSVIFLIAAYAFIGREINIILIIRSLFPTLSNNNWYLTCYMLFYAIHTFLNKIIWELDQRSLLKVSMVLSFLYIFCNFVIDDRFQSSDLILWIAIYFCVAYMKLYLKNFTKNKKLNCGLVIFGLFGNTGLILLTNCLGLKISFLSSYLLYWAKNAQPFFIIAAIGLFNLANCSSYKNRFINELSGLSLLVYIIHENIFIRTYFRPFLFQYIYETYGYDYILVWILLLTVLFFAISAFLGFLYKASVQKLVKKVSDKIYILLSKSYAVVEEIMLKLE